MVCTPRRVHTIFINHISYIYILFYFFKELYVYNIIDVDSVDKYIFILFFNKLCC